MLTRREEDVVRLLAEGLQNREIAKELKLSEHTVRNYLFHIFEKLGVSSRVELVLYAVSSSKGMKNAGVHGDDREDEQAGGSEVAGKSPAASDQGSGAKPSQSPMKKPKR